MSAAPEVISPQNVAEIAVCWKNVHMVGKDNGKGPLAAKSLSGDASSSSDELNTKVRKPYTITKQRERWTENEHQKFLEALKQYGRAWRRIEEYIGTKTAVQSRRRLEREASAGSSAGKLPDIAIPPPRPKRKPNRPYPKKAGNSIPALEDESKEASSLSPSAVTAAAYPEGFQPGSFNPSMNQGLGSGTAAFMPSPLLRGNFVGPHGSVKIFGKTVVVPRADKPACHPDVSRECLVNKDNVSPGKQSPVAELKQTAGFSPFVKIRKIGNSFSEVGRNVCESGAIESEGTGESLGRTCWHDSVDDTESAGSLAINNGRECRTRGEAGLTKVDIGSLTVEGEKVESGSPTVEGEICGTQFPQMVNPVLKSWIDSFSNFHDRASISPIPANAVVEGAPNGSLNYWQFMQAAAVNYAAYTAAVAAAAAAGWKASNMGGTDSFVPPNTANTNTDKVQLPSIPAWWPYRRFIPSVYFSPSGVLHQGENSDACDGRAVGKVKQVEVLNGSPLRGDQHDTVSRSAGGVELDEPDLDMDGEDYGKDHTTINSSIQHGRRLETSCITEASGSAKESPDLESQHDVHAMVMPGKHPMRASDTETRTNIPQNEYSSSDEFEEGDKKQGGGSSSGSNTPLSRSQSSDCDAPAIPETKKRDIYSLSGGSNVSCSETFQNPHQQSVINTVDLPKLRVKHAEKARKHQQRDSWHAGADDSKRFKSCAHYDLELRKEVSEEGRKAFQALFTSKSLPQTFLIANLDEGGTDISWKHEYVSKPTVFKTESRLCESIHITGLPHGEGDKANDTATLDETVNRGSPKNGQMLVNGTSFTISVSSGFVPYRRPVAQSQ